MTVVKIADARRKARKTHRIIAARVAPGEGGQWVSYEYDDGRAGMEQYATPEDAERASKELVGPERAMPAKVGFKKRKKT